MMDGQQQDLMETINGTKLQGVGLRRLQVRVHVCSCVRHDVLCELNLWINRPYFPGLHSTKEACVRAFVYVRVCT
jgi:hypothetical protein